MSEHTIKTKTNVVKVKFLDATRTKPVPQGREYTYLTEGPEPINLGDVVVANTYKGESKAVVTKVNVPVSEIQPWIDNGTAKTVRPLNDDEYEGGDL